VPRFLATLHIIKDPKRYGMDLVQGDMACPIDYELVRTQKSMKLQDIALNLNVSTETLILLNSELRHQQTPDKEYSLKVPPDSASSLPWWRTGSKRRSRLSMKGRRVGSTSSTGSGPGETIQTISSQYGVPSKTILAYNGLSSQAKIKSGKVIRIPLATASKSKMTKVAVARRTRVRRWPHQVRAYLL